MSERTRFLQTDSLILAFDSPLICSREEISNVLQSVVYVGSLIGFFIFSFVADNYGRKIGLGISWFMAFLGALMIGVPGSRGGMRPLANFSSA